MSTPRSFINTAYGMSSKNQPNEIANEATELVNQVTAIVNSIFVLAARINPTYFGVTLAVAESSSTWPRPTDAESVWLIELAGARVNVVPFDDQAAAPAPRVFRFGAVYREPTGDSTAGSMDFYYSSRPTAATIDTNIDTRFPTAYDELIAQELAIYLANKDGREEELPGLFAARDRWLGLFISFLQHETVGEVRRYDEARVFHTEEQIPLSALFLGTKLTG